MSIYQNLFSFFYSWLKLLFANQVEFFVALKGKKCYCPCSYFWFEIVLIQLHILKLEQWPMYLNINMPTIDEILNMLCKHAILSKFLL
jgi:hypothetical protein